MLRARMQPGIDILQDSGEGLLVFGLDAPESDRWLLPPDLRPAHPDLGQQPLILLRPHEGCGLENSFLLRTGVWPPASGKRNRGIRSCG